MIIFGMKGRGKTLGVFDEKKKKKGGEGGRKREGWGT